MARMLMQKFRLSEKDVKIINKFCELSGQTKVSFIQNALINELKRNEDKIDNETKKYLKEQQKELKFGLNEELILKRQKRLQKKLKKFFTPRSIMQRVGKLASSSGFLNDGEIKNMKVIQAVIDDFVKITRLYDKKTRAMIKDDMEVIKMLKGQSFLLEFIKRRQYVPYDMREKKHTEIEFNAVVVKDGKK